MEDKHILWIADDMYDNPEKYLELFVKNDEQVIRSNHKFLSDLIANPDIDINKTQFFYRNEVSYNGNCPSKIWV